MLFQISDSGFNLCSKFKDIYDEDHFISTLENDVRVVNKIPEYIMERFDHNMSNVYNFRVKAWSPVHYYRDSVLPRLLEEKWVEMLIVASLFSLLKFLTPSIYGHGNGLWWKNKALYLFKLILFYWK